MRRTWLFVPGADPAAHAAAARSGARALSAQAFATWRKAGAIAAVRVNPLESGGAEDLAGIARPDIVMMSKVASPQEVRRQEESAPAGVELVPNIESAAALLRTGEIARASPRVSALLVASEDMVADLGTVRSRGGEEPAYVRARFLVECRAAGAEAIDAPYTFGDVKGAVADARYARRLGYRMKSLVDASHARAINAALTPSAAELAKARRTAR